MALQHDGEQTGEKQEYCEAATNHEQNHPAAAWCTLFFCVHTPIRFYAPACAAAAHLDQDSFPNPQLHPIVCRGDAIDAHVHGRDQIIGGGGQDGPEA